MNLKYQAKRLEASFNEEVKKEIPMALLPDGSIAYKDYIIKSTKTKQFQVIKKGGVKIDTFFLKTCALMGIDLYAKNRLSSYSEIKLLDQKYKNNIIDAEIFKYKFKNTKDPDKRDLFLWRWEITKNRANHARTEIASRFRSMF